jgi:DNA-directed RNA polymerase specialized sigma24 family protein
MEDLAVADVAHAMRISQGTVKGYLKEGRERALDAYGNRSRTNKKEQETA